MLKKSISLVLCLIICLSIATTAAVPTIAAYNVKTLFSVKGGTVEGDLLTYTINITKGQNDIGGIILNVDFDSKVLAPVQKNCAPVKKTTTADGTVNNFEGIYMHGVSETNPNTYVIAYTNDIAVSTTETKGFFKMQFKVIDKTRPATYLRFYCNEYYSVTENHKNITHTDGRQIIADIAEICTLAKPELKSVKPALNGLKVSWNAVEGALGYQIMRGTSADGWESATTTEVDASKTSFVDAKVVSGKTYTYTIRAFNNYGVSYYDSEGISSKYVEKPTILSLKNAINGVSVKWNSISGAEFYLVYRRKSDETKWTQIAKKSVDLATSYIDESVVDGVTYEYDVVSSTDSCSSPNATTGEKITYIAAPTLSGVENTLKGIKIKWNSHPKATHYIIYRRDKGFDPELVEYMTVSGTSYVDTGVSVGSIYVYSIKACTNVGESAYNTTGCTITRVANTEVTKLTVEKNGIKVAWAPVKGVDGYRIYRKNTAESKWKEAGIVGSSVNSFKDTKLLSGTEYCYAVCPIISESEGAKIESDYIYYIAAPENVKVENIAAGIKVTWEKSDGATKYILMRSEGSSAYTKITEISATKALQFIDENVKWNKTYTYTVKAVSSKGESLVNTSKEIVRLGAMGVTTPKLCSGGIKVTWKAASGADAYVVFRNDGNGWVQVKQVTKNEYVDKNVKSGTTYAYAVCAVVDGSRGILSTDKAPKFKYIAPTSSVTAANGTNYTKITWKAVKGAVTYQVYKSTNSDFSNATLVAKVSSDKLSCVDKSVTAGKTYYYRVRTNDGEKLSMYSSTLKNVFLTAPKIKSIANDYKGVKFTWGAVKGAQSYRLYRKVYGDKSWTYIKTVDSSTLSYTDSGATDGKVMYYTVKAMNKSGSSTVVSQKITYIKAPKVTLSNTASGVYVKWDKHSSAKAYYVYRKAGSEKEWTRIAEVKTPYYTDKNVKSGTNYIYTVRTYNGKVYSGYNSAGWKYRYLSVPKLVSATNGYGAVVVKWEKVAGATSYQVYRKENGAKIWTSLGETKSLSYKDTKVKNKATYTYTVRACYGKDRSHYNTKGISVKYLAAPKVSVANRTGNVTLTWDAVSGASSYYVYRKVGNAASWTRIATVSKPGYIDKKVSNKTIYTYTVVAEGSKTKSGYYGSGWKTVYLDTPDMLSVQSTQKGVTFKWASVKGCTSYSVFRKDSNGIWKQIGSVDAKTVSFTDKKVEKGVKYTYTVRAKYGNYLSWYEDNMTCTHKY